MSAFEKRTVAISNHHENMLKRIQKQFDFSQEQEVYKFALGFAVSKKIETPTSPMPMQRTTKWASGNFDANGEVSSLISTLYPDADDIRLQAMILAEAGLVRINDFLDHNEEVDTLSDLLELT
ncbi:hypothetical protein OAB85_03500 [Pseudomonadales bacterium]|nr:hypothetical protein [Pseudomonadales bacterium]